MAHLQISKIIPGTRGEVFDYLIKPENQTALLAPKLEVEALNPEVALKRGSEISFRMTRLGLVQSVRLRIEDLLRGSRLTYRQSEGLFTQWTHTMRFDDHDDKSCLVTDLVDYELPFGVFGTLFDDLLVKSDMQALLETRLEKTAAYFTEFRRA